MHQSASVGSSPPGMSDMTVNSIIKSLNSTRDRIRPVLLPPAVDSTPSKTSVDAVDKDKIASSPISQSVSSRSAKLHAVTYASHGGRDDRFCRAVESAIRHGVELIILGWGIKWRGLSQKLEAAHAYASALPSNDVILFTDAFDVMFTNSPDIILKEFESMDGDIIFAGECGCWPHVTIDRGRPCFESYPQSPTPYRYLNSGTWIGRAGRAAEMLAAVIKEAGKDFANANDQKLVADMFMEKRYGLRLDYHARLFQSMHMTFDKPLPYCNPAEDIEVVGDGRFHNKRTHSSPSVFHFNGGGKKHHLKMESKLWYKAAKYNTPEQRNKLATTVISTPIDEFRNRTMQFNKICTTYFK